MMKREIAPRIINTNIKTRRLGYVISLTELLGNKFLLVDDLQRRLEAWAIEHQKDLEKYHSKSGAITKSPRHYPASRYIHLAENLGLVKISRNECALTKIGQPVPTLTKSEQNPFKLSVEQTCYLLKRILEHDFDYIFPLLRLLKNHNRTKEIFSCFKVAVLEHLEMQRKKISDIVRASGFKKREELMMKWTRERKYLENIIYPRLDWLLDLYFLDHKKYKERIYKLTDGGKSFVEKLERAQVDINLHDFDKWLNEQYYETFGRCFIEGNVILFKELKEEESKKYVCDLLEEAFGRFSPHGLPFQHISANTFLEFSCAKLVGMKIVPTFNQLKNILKSLSTYRFQWQPSMRDGFIMKI